MRYGDFRAFILAVARFHIAAHPVADIGLYGVKRRIGDEVVPHYVLQVGGRLGNQQTHLAEGKHAVPAENIPDLIVALLEAFIQSRSCPDFHAFLEQDGSAVIDRLVALQAVGVTG